MKKKCYNLYNLYIYKYNYIYNYILFSLSVLEPSNTLRGVEVLSHESSTSRFILQPKEIEKIYNRESETRQRF